MNVTSDTDESPITQPSAVHNQSSRMPEDYMDYNILGPILFWVYQTLLALEGVLAIIFNPFTLIAIYR